jgi:hypothetical protein
MHLGMQSYNNSTWKLTLFLRRSRLEGLCRKSWRLGLQDCTIEKTEGTAFLTRIYRVGLGLLYLGKRDIRGIKKDICAKGYAIRFLECLSSMFEGIYTAKRMTNYCVSKEGIFRNLYILLLLGPLMSSLPYQYILFISKVLAKLWTPSIIYSSSSIVNTSSESSN